MGLQVPVAGTTASTWPPPGPTGIEQYLPGRRIDLVRNENWDPKTDPLRSAWVDQISVTIGHSETEIQE